MGHAKKTAGATKIDISSERLAQKQEPILGGRSGGRLELG